MNPLRVLHGFSVNAGQPSILAAELRNFGVEAKSITIGGNAYGYDTGAQYPDRNLPTLARMMSEEFPSYDIIHIHALTPYITRYACQFPMGIDLLTAKAMGKRIVMHFRGSEVRSPTAFAKACEHNYVSENPRRVFTNFNDEWVPAYLKLCRALADEVVVSDPELQTYVGAARIIPRAIDLSQWRRPEEVKKNCPLIVHAPSKREIKGTESLLVAVKSLQNEGLNFEFRLVENLPHSIAKSIYRDADIIVDQLRIGWYGVLSVEGMALGKAVIAYIRDDLLPFFEGRQPPVANANPNNIAEILRTLIVDTDARSRQAKIGYQFCVAYHDSKAVAQNCLRLYEEILSRPSRIDIDAYLDVMAKQSQMPLSTIARTRTVNNISAVKQRFLALLRRTHTKNRDRKPEDPRN